MSRAIANRWRSTLLVVLLSAMVFVGLPASPSYADWCYVSGNHSYSNDIAWAEDPNNMCGVIYVRHKYDPIWSGNNYWTSWYSTSGTYVQTPSTPELMTSERYGWI